MMKHQAKKGFTLIEVAVVIAIIAILAAVAMVRFSDVQDDAEMTTVEDFTRGLRSAQSLYLAESGQPNAFTDFVTQGPIVAGSTETISVQNIGKGGCTVAANTINCTAADFPNINTQHGIIVTFTRQANGQISNNLP